jgi:hypothetical protein
VRPTVVSPSQQQTVALLGVQVPGQQQLALTEAYPALERRDGTGPWLAAGHGPALLVVAAAVRPRAERVPAAGRDAVPPPAGWAA